MSNILIDELPESIEISGKAYEINTDSKTCILALTAFEDNRLTLLEKQQILLFMMLPVLPEDSNDIKQALEQINIFLSGGETKEKESSNVRLYSFQKDSQYIYSAFKQTHNINLQKESLHWWEFLSLFMDLGSETFFCQLLGLRKRLATGKASKEDRQFAAENSHIVRLESVDDRTVEEKEIKNRFDELVAQGLKKRKNG